MVLRMVLSMVLRKDIGDRHDDEMMMIIIGVVSYTLYLVFRDDANVLV